MQKIIPWLTAGFFALSIHSAFAKTPTETAHEYFAAFQQGNYQGLATMYDPAALQSFREMMGFLTELDLGDDGEVLATLFGPEATVQTVNKMSDQEFFALFFENVFAQVQSMGELSFDNMKIIGEVKESDNLVHVLARNKTSIGEMEIEAMEVISFKQVGEDWKVLLSGEIKGMANQMRQALGI